MTNKQEQILETALRLFANDGYNATSTSKIAKEAGVSEGLIFRHFENKKGLLNAIMQSAALKLLKAVEHILFESDPKLVIRKTICLPFESDEADHPFWKLQFKLKWEQEYNKPELSKPLMDKLTWAFSELRNKEPEKEALLLYQLVDSISQSILRDGKEVHKDFQLFLLSKYSV
jgi:AcrR family transcriptional regulator